MQQIETRLCETDEADIKNQKNTSLNQTYHKFLLKQIDLSLTCLSLRIHPFSRHQSLCVTF